MRITDTLPADVTFITTTRTAGLSISGNQLVWDIGTVGAQSNNAGSITVRAKINSTAAPGTILNNIVQIGQNQADAAPENNQFNAAITVVTPIYDVSVQKSLETYCPIYPGPICDFPQGALVNYEIQYNNSGNTIAPNVKLTDTLPFDGAEFVTTSLTTGFSRSGNQLVWDLGDVPLNVFNTYANRIRVTLRIPEVATPSTLFTNTATIGMSVADANPSNSTSQVTSRVITATRDLSASKTICRLTFYNAYDCYYPPGPNEVRAYVPGDTVRYYISFRNTGNATASGVRLTDTLPFAGATFVTATQNTSVTLSGSQFIWDIGEVAGTPNPWYGVGSSLYLDLKVPPNAVPGTLFTNTVQVSLNETDLSTSNNTSVSVGQVVTPMVNLRVQKSSVVPKTLPGRRFTYDITIAHNENDLQSNTYAEGVRVTDTLPSGLTALSYSFPQSATVSGNQIVWSLGRLARADAQLLTITVQTGDVPLGTTLTNTVQVGAAQHELNPSDNSASTAVLVYTPTVPLAVSKIANTGFALPGEVITYTLTAYQANYLNGYYFPSEGDATQVTVTDTLPSGLTVLSTTWPASVTFNGNLLTWNVGTLSHFPICYGYTPCSSASLHILARVNEAPIGTRITNTALITSSEIPLNLSLLSSTHHLLVGEPNSYQSMTPWDRIALETGGQAFRLVQDYDYDPPVNWNLIESMAFADMQATADVVYRSGQVFSESYSYECNYAFCTGPVTHTIHLDSAVTQIQILLKANGDSWYYGYPSMISLMQVVAPNGTIALSGTQAATGVITKAVKGIYQVIVPSPAHGQWKLIVGGRGSYQVSVAAVASPLTLLSKPGLLPNQPGALKVQGSAMSGASFGILDGTGTPTVTLNLLDDGAHNDGTYGGTWTPTTLGSYFLAMSGTTSLNNAPEAGPYQRITTKPLHVQNLIVTGPGTLNTTAGSSSSAIFTITNHNSTTRTVDMAYSQSSGWASLASAPARIYLGPGQSQAVTIAYSVPATATDFSTAQIQVLAQSAYAAEFGDYETAQIVARVYADVGVSGSLPANVRPGQNVTLTIAYSNTGGAVANGLQLAAVLPAGLSYISDTSGVTPARNGNQWVWSLPALPANGSGGFMLMASAAANAAGNLNVTLSISTSSDEINLPNNNATPTTQVQPGNSLRKVFLPLIRR